MEKTGFCDVGCGAGLTFLGVFLDSNFFGESAAECEYAANSGLFSGKFVGKKLSPKVKKSSKM